MFVRFGSRKEIDVREKAKDLLGLMKVTKAAEYCGVTAETMRNWDRSGRLVPERNPIDQTKLISMVAKYTQNIPLNELRRARSERSRALNATLNK